MPLALGLVHVALVAPHYFVGSFDDDASYILTARALVAGQGLTGHIASGAGVAAVYPPGYSALLAPLVWLWPHTFVPLRLLSTVCYAALFPLTWIYLGRRRIGEGTRTAALVVLALGPPLATYGSMVMAETPFLVLLVLLLLLVDRWDAQARILTRAGLGVVAAAAALVWLKEAGIGLVAGLVLWLLLRGAAARRKAALVAVGVAALLAPVVIVRLATGVPVAGARYSQELGGYYQGGLVDRLVHVAPHALWQLLSTALPATLVPYLSPLPIHGHTPDLWKVLSWQVTVLTVIGAVVWARRHRDAAVVMVPIYLAETLLWPYINERRVILVLPLLAAWYVLGAKTVWDTVRARRGRTRAAPRLAGGWPALARPATAGALAVLIVVAPLAAQLPRDYLLNAGQSTSHFEGSPYAGILAQLGSPTDVVETDYLYSTALFTGHLTAGTAFTETLSSCYVPGALAAIASDNAGYLLVGDLNKPGNLDSPCLYGAAASGSWAVELLHTNRDDASVFELVGPGTGHPDRRDLTAAAAVTETAGPAAAPSVTLTWQWSHLQPVTQVSVGAAGATGTTSVTVQLRVADGAWQTVAAARSSVGDGPGAVPYLLATLPAGVDASALRVIVHGVTTATVSDVHALGPTVGP
ncbi:MAG TPA: hypothetical protein VGL49_01720 [Acidimicrobiales bacterium]